MGFLPKSGSLKLSPRSFGLVPKKPDVTQRCAIRFSVFFWYTKSLESNSKLDDWKMGCIEVPFGAFSLGPIFRGYLYYILAFCGISK